MSETESKRVRRVAKAITVDLDLCKACGICRNLCPKDVFDLDERGYPLVSRLDQCSVCFFCEYHCPDFALSVAYRDEARAARRNGKPAPGKPAPGKPAPGKPAPGKRRSAKPAPAKPAPAKPAPEKGGA